MSARLENGFLQFERKSETRSSPLHSPASDPERMLETALVRPGGAVATWLETNGLRLQVEDSDKRATAGMIIIDDRIVELEPEGHLMDIVFQVPDTNRRVGINFCYLDTYYRRALLGGWVGKFEDFVAGFLSREKTLFYSRYLEARNDGMGGLRVLRRLEGLLMAMIEDGLIPTLEPTELKRYQLYRHYLEKKELLGKVVLYHPHRYATMR